MNKKYLEFSELTKPNQKIKKIVGSFKGNNREKIRQIVDWIGDNLERKPFEKKSFRKCTVREIVNNGCYRNCSDVALVFISFARLSDIPTKYVYVMEGRGIKENYSHQAGGHTLGKCFLNGKWVYVDPYPNPLYGVFWGDKIPGDKWTFYHEGKNWKELGLDSWEKMKKAAKEKTPQCEIKIPSKIFYWAIKKAKEKDKKASDLLRKLMKKGYKETST